jgi:two-component system, OmpR family, phosphate regulon sensor histidine kinase PhoR
MYLEMILTNKKIALRIGIISTLLLLINSYLINYVLINFTFLHQLIIVSFIVISFFVIIYSITYKFLLPINDVVNILKEIRESSRNVITKINNPIWNDIDKELNKLINKINTDINQIESLGKTRTQFLANVSHELKTPIFTLKGYVDLLLDGAINDTEVNKEFLQKIKSQAYRLETIFTDLIDITRIESGDLQMKFDWFNFNELLIWIKENFEYLANERDLKLSIPDNINFDIYADKNRLQTVFSNLITNAINYSDQGIIRLSVKTEHDKLKVKILDNGIGMLPKNQKRIFERFFREDADRSRKTGGSGIGLAIVKHILDAHQTEINIDSKKNIGTTIGFSLPYRSCGK